MRCLIGINEPDVVYVQYKPIGNKWTQCFLECHPYLQTAIAHRIELAQVTKMSSKAIKNWYNILFQTVDSLGILWQNTYNCDETGFAIGKGKAIWVVIDTEVCQKYIAELDHQG